MTRPRKPLRIHLFGGFRMTVGDDVVLDQGWSRRKALALLKVVTLQPGGQVLRDQVCELLWPDLDPRAATNNLHKNLHYLREAVSGHTGDGGLISLRGDVLRLSGEVAVDLHEFLAASETARGSGDPAAYDRALEFVKHELLPEDAYEEWAASARESLAVTTGALLREAAALDIGGGRWDAAIERIRDLLTLDPTDEDAHRTLMQLYFQSGSRHRALRQFEICREVLESELGVEPSPKTVALHQKLLDEEPAEAPPEPVTSAAAVPAKPAPRPPVTFGRERELAIIEGAVDEAVAGAGSMLLLVGEAGIGKSHLLRHAEAAAREAGAVALYGRAYEFDAQAPYQPLRGILRELMASELAPRVEALLRRSLYLRRLLPDATLDSGTRSETADLQAELFEEVWRLFAAIIAEQPLVLLLDDLHAAEEGTLRLVHFLARRAPEGRVLVIGAARGEWSGSRDALNSLRSVLRRDRVAREVRVEPLDEQAVRLVAQAGFEGGRVDSDLLSDVVGRSQGNPLFARELASSFIEEGWARFERDRWRRRSGGHAPIPLAAHDMLQHRLEHLSDAARDLVNAAAVSPIASGFAVLQEVSGIERRVALDALDECISSGLLEEAEPGYRFRHELVRQAAYDALTTARRQQLHRASADALLRSPGGGEPGIVSYHLAESDEPWQAVPHLLEAARRAENVFAHEQAKEALEKAVQMAREHERLVEPAVFAQAVEALADLERRLGDILASVPLFEEAAARFGAAGEAESAARARGKAALGHIVLGNAAEAQRHIEQTLHALTDHSPQHVVSRTYYLLAQLHWHSGQNRDALDAARQALLAAQDSADPHQQAQAYEVLALACHSLGDWQQGVEYELSRQAIGVSGFDTDEAFDAHL